MQNPPTAKVANSQKSKSKSRINKRQRNRRRNKLKSLNNNQNKGTGVNFATGRLGRGIVYQKTDADIWREAYKNAVRWHGEHQTNFWRRTAETLHRENQEYRQQLMLNFKPDVYFESSDDDEEDDEPVVTIKNEVEPDEDDDQIDVQYLEFLQITFKHREELRLKREADAQEAVDSQPETTEN